MKSERCHWQAQTRKTLLAALLKHRIQDASPAGLLFPAILWSCRCVCHLVLCSCRVAGLLVLLFPWIASLALDSCLCRNPIQDACHKLACLFANHSGVRQEQQIHSSRYSDAQTETPMLMLKPKCIAYARSRFAWQCLLSMSGAQSLFIWLEPNT
jgi:hypothetical protein